jgi:arginine deiminase
MDGKIKAEWNPLKKMVMHRPGIEMFLGLLEPYGSLYERAFSRQGARREHERLVNILRTEFNVEVKLLKHTILEAAEKNAKIRERLIEMARETMEYGGEDDNIALAKREFENNVKYFDTQHFFNMLLFNPLIDLGYDKGHRDINLQITSRQPLANLFFMRDQQFVTDSGIVLCRMSKPSRRKEPQITKFLWEEVMGIPTREIKAPGTIEGGEFIPFGKFALVGIGDRTNRSAIDQLLSWEYGYEEIGVVHQPMHPLISSNHPDPMVNMHLDTYFNVASSNVVVGSELLLKNAMVEVYHNEGYGKFRRDDNDITLYDYIVSKGFTVVNITTLEQLSYASNFLCIRDGQILAVEVERVVKDVLNNLQLMVKKDPKRYSKLYEQAKQDYDYLRSEGEFFPHKKEIYMNGIDAYPIILRNLTGGYGAAHCMTCALNRGD